MPFASPSFISLTLSWATPTETVENAPPSCRKAVRLGNHNDENDHGLCRLFPEFYCREDLDVDVGGTGDHHRLVRVIGDFLYGSLNQGTGIADDIASFTCIIDPDEAPDRFLDALLLHLGFDLSLPLSEADKRKIIPLLVDLYKQKGSEPGVENALSLLLGIPVNIIPIGASFDGFECGEPFSLTLTAITTGVDFVDVSDPDRFEVGKNIVIVDTTPPYVIFEDTPITDIQSNRVFFAAQTLTGTIEIGAQVFCDRFCDQVGSPGQDLICDELGVDSTAGSQDQALYGFYVDIQRTVLTTTALQDGDVEVDVDNSDYIVVGSRVRITDQIAPLNPPIVLTVKEKDGLTIRFDPVSLSETIEAGAATINLFNAEELSLINQIVEFAKPAHTFHLLTRDDATAEAVVG